MLLSHRTSIIALAVLAPGLLAAAGLAPENVTVGQNLEVIANVTLDQPAPTGGLEITLTTSDPKKVLLSRTPEEIGAPQIKLMVREGFRGSPDYYVQGFASAGTATYTATAPGLTPGHGTVTLAPSGVILFRSGMGLPRLMTTTGAGKSDLIIHTALLDAEHNYVHQQPVAGGRPITVSLASSDTKVATVAPATVTMAGGSALSSFEFHPIAPGQTTLSLSVPPGFSAPAQFGSATASVIVPGIGITDEVSIGRNLQITGVLTLGEPASAAVTVTLTSSEPGKLLLSKQPNEPGVDSLKIEIPAGGVRGSYYLQALADAGEVQYTATASGFRARTATVTLTPSGLVLGGPQGPPDEAELLNKEIAEGPHGFVTSLAAKPMVVSVYAVQLDPKTLRGADLTVQAVRPGVSIAAELIISHPAVGKLMARTVVISAGASSATTHFVPAGIGRTEVALATPPGYRKPSNSTSLTVTVNE